MQVFVGRRSSEYFKYSPLKQKQHLYKISFQNYCKSQQVLKSLHAFGWWTWSEASWPCYSSFWWPMHPPCTLPKAYRPIQGEIMESSAPPWDPEIKQTNHFKKSISPNLASQHSARLIMIHFPIGSIKTSSHKAYALGTCLIKQTLARTEDSSIFPSSPGHTTTLPNADARCFSSASSLKASAKTHTHSCVLRVGYI